MVFCYRSQNKDRNDTINFNIFYLIQNFQNVITTYNHIEKIIDEFTSIFFTLSLQIQCVFNTYSRSQFRLVTFKCSIVICASGYHMGQNRARIGTYYWG